MDGTGVQAWPYSLLKSLFPGLERNSDIVLLLPESIFSFCPPGSVVESLDCSPETKKGGPGGARLVNEAGGGSGWTEQSISE